MPAATSPLGARHHAPMILPAAQPGDLCAAIDLGTHSFRLEVGCLDEGSRGGYRSLHEDKEAVRLGDGLDERGSIDAATLARAERSVERFAEVLRSFGLIGGDAGANPLSRMPRARAVATEALRSASNQTDVLHTLQQALGLPIDILSAQEEAQLTYLGVLRAHPADAPRDPCVVIDIGGGSTEVVAGLGTQVLALDSLGLGSLNVTRRWLAPALAQGASLAQALNCAREGCEQALASSSSLQMRALVSGATRVLASAGVVSLVVKAHQQQGRNLKQVQVNHLQWCLDQCQSSPSWFDWLRRGVPGVDAARRDTLVGGCLLLQTIMARFELDAISPTRGSLQHGVLASLQHSVLEPV